jgi:hypothetical protein
MVSTTTVSSCSDNIDFIDDFIGIEEDDGIFDTEEIKQVEKENNNYADLDYYTLTQYNNDNLTKDDELFAAPKVYITEKVKDICRVNGLPYHFKSREETKFLIRLSQCKVNPRYNIPKNDERRYYIKCCSYPDKSYLAYLGYCKGVM